MSEILCTIDVCVEVHGAYEDNVLSWFAGSHRGLLRASVQLLIGIVFNINTVFNHVNARVRRQSFELCLFFAADNNMNVAFLKQLSF